MTNFFLLLILIVLVLILAVVSEIGTFLMRINKYIDFVEKREKERI
jgi:hypothetical protein